MMFFLASGAGGENSTCSSTPGSRSRPGLSFALSSDQPQLQTRSARGAWELAMDYSAVLPGEEHPGNSPWASSPGHNRAAFEQPPGGEIPPTTLPESMYASTGEASPAFESQQS